MGKTILEVPPTLGQVLRRTLPVPEPQDVAIREFLTKQGWAPENP